MLAPHQGPTVTMETDSIPNWALTAPWNADGPALPCCRGPGSPVAPGVGMGTESHRFAACPDIWPPRPGDRAQLGLLAPGPHQPQLQPGEVEEAWLSCPSHAKA